VVILGEVHDNAEHHLNQARAVAAIRPAAVVWEMLSPAQVAGMDPEATGTPETLARSLDWEAGGWPDFAHYWPIFEAARGVPVVGAALPRDTVRRAVGEGAAAPFGDGAARYGLTAALPEAEQALREAEQMRVHCDALPEAMLGGMVEAQRLRDAAFARAVVEAQARFGSPVVLITGNGHARTDRGVPAALALAAPDLSVLSVGQLEGGPDEAAPPYDLWLVTEAAEREDPCAVFAK
jgi:uncharacterized iron-regulated protein